VNNIESETFVKKKCHGWLQQVGQPDDRIEKRMRRGKITPPEADQFFIPEILP
jgi:hypothetical protein